MPIDSRWRRARSIYMDMLRMMSINWLDNTISYERQMTCSYDSVHIAYLRIHTANQSGKTQRRNEIQTNAIELRETTFSSSQHYAWAHTIRRNCFVYASNSGRPAQHSIAIDLPALRHSIMFVCIPNPTSIGECEEMRVPLQERESSRQR